VGWRGLIERVRKMNVIEVLSIPQYKPSKVISRGECKKREKNGRNELKRGIICRKRYRYRYVTPIYYHIVISFKYTFT
jgi:hypothetical protein